MAALFNFARPDKPGPQKPGFRSLCCIFRLF